MIELNYLIQPLEISLVELIRAQFFKSQFKCDKSLIYDILHYYMM